MADRFGLDYARPPIDALFLLVLLVGVVVLLMPVAAFVGAAARIGGEARDRRLAAVRLVGADRAMARRIAAGEVLAGAVAGVALGGLGFVVLPPARRAGRAVGHLACSPPTSRRRRRWSC